MSRCCSICLEEIFDVEDPNTFGAECGHQSLFHAKCLKSWISESSKNTLSVCPICRGPMHILHNELMTDDVHNAHEPIPSSTDNRRIDTFRVQASVAMHVFFLVVLHVVAALFHYYDACTDIACISTVLSFCQATSALSAFSWPTRPDRHIVGKIMALTIGCFLTRTLHLACSTSGPVGVCVDIMCCNLACSLMALVCVSRRLLDDS